MKTDSINSSNSSNINFGITYLKPSLKYMKPINRKKLVPSIPIGQIYPNDIYLGATPKGDLTVEVTRSSLYDYLSVNGLFYQNDLSLNKLVKAFNNAWQILHGRQYPVQKKVLYHIDDFSDKMIIDRILTEVEDYNEKYKKLFNN